MCTVCPLLNAIKGCIRKLLRKPFLKLILVAKFLYVYDILILSFENNQKNIFRKKLRYVEIVRFSHIGENRKENLINLRN